MSRSFRGIADHNLEEIWRRVHEVMIKAIQQRGIPLRHVAATGITN
jgi:glycerol kinase